MTTVFPFAIAHQFGRAKNAVLLLRKAVQTVLKEHIQYFEQNEGRKSDINRNDRPENAFSGAIQSLLLFRRHRINFRDICR